MCIALYKEQVSSVPAPKRAFQSNVESGKQLRKGGNGGMGRMVYYSNGASFSYIEA